MAVDSEYTIRILNLWEEEKKEPQKLLEDVRTSLNIIISESADFYPTFMTDDTFAAALYSCAVNGVWNDLCSNMIDLSQNFKNLVFYVEEKTSHGDNGYVFWDGNCWMRSMASPFDQLSGEQPGTELPPTWIRDLMISYRNRLADD